MSVHQDRLRESGLQFFGKVTASISHEIRNVLAVIHEHAGLIKDMLVMADRGGAVDLTRIDGIAEKVEQQIRRAGGILDNMNRFAHSVDEPYHRVDVGETLRLVRELYGRFAAAYGVQIEEVPAGEPVMVTTSPFFLQHLMALCLDFAIVATGEGKTVRPAVDGGREGARITFSGLESLEKEAGIAFPSEREEVLMRTLGAEIELDVPAAQCVLVVPGKSVT